jgi:hypothetical protein
VPVGLAILATAIIPINIALYVFGFALEAMPKGAFIALFVALALVQTCSGARGNVTDVPRWRVGYSSRSAVRIDPKKALSLSDHPVSEANTKKRSYASEIGPPTASVTNFSVPAMTK